MAKSPVLDRAAIENRALSYLNRFDVSVARLRQVLLDFVRRRAGELGVDASCHSVTIEDVLTRYQSSGLVDDQRYAATMARHLAERGASRQAIRSRLSGRGIPREIVSAVVASLETEEGSELEAARALVRRRKLGRYRPGPWNPKNYGRALGALARAGFDFDTAKRALELEGSPEPGDSQ